MQWAGSSTAWDLSSETFHSVFTSAYAKGLLEIYYVELVQTKTGPLPAQTQQFTGMH